MIGDESLVMMVGGVVVVVLILSIVAKGGPANPDPQGANKQPEKAPTSSGQLNRLGAWEAQEVERERIRTEMQQLRDEAKPVFLVDLDIPFAALIGLVIKIAIVQALVFLVVGAAVFLALLAVDAF